MQIKSVLHNTKIYINPKQVIFQGYQFNIGSTMLEVRLEKSLIYHVKLPQIVLKADNKPFATEIEQAEYNDKIKNLRAIAVVENKIVYSNGPKLYSLSSNYKMEQPTLNEIATGNFVVGLCNNFPLIIDKSNSKEINFDGISISDTENMFQEILGNFDLAAKYFEKQQNLVLKRREK
ncbi:Hypothetical_protein [Hexamita inflata]|uniref:Hypothetical_protein n=1 Tax=Hexamita inflata TaxID=28002 RepID=A0AA86UGL7_9EUKA|nr:Hypothetical protein HINF_LOCUS27333 [Hexamita inflata]CAI9972226.1 Hypothetical protein HINF_LOCUS59871 [Hexamita inflata]